MSSDSLLTSDSSMFIHVHFIIKSRKITFGYSIKACYRRTIGRLIYLLHTRLDVAYAVSIVSQFMHWEWKHLQNTSLFEIFTKALLFARHDHLKVEAYTVADWLGQSWIQYLLWDIALL